MHPARAALDNALTHVGQDIILRRVVGQAPTTANIDIEVRAFVRSFTAQEIASGIAESDLEVILSASTIYAEQWPGGQVATPASPEPSLPRRNDKVIIDGRVRNIEMVKPLRIGPELVRLEFAGVRLMAGLTVKVEPIDRDIKLIMSEELSPEARSDTLAAYAKDVLVEVDAINAAVLGRPVPHTTYVDGVKDAQEETVKPDGTIVYDFALTTDLLVWIGQQLTQHSPVGSGRDPHPGQYRRSHTLYADGVEVPIGDNVPPATEYVFVSDLPYARKVEGMAGHAPSSRQSPDGVYEVVAALARAKYGNVAKVSFGWRAPVSSHLVAGPGGNKSALRFPAIIVKGFY